MKKWIARAWFGLVLSFIFFSALNALGPWLCGGLFVVIVAWFATLWSIHQLDK